MSNIERIWSISRDHYQGKGKVVTTNDSFKSKQQEQPRRPFYKKAIQSI